MFGYRVPAPDDAMMISGGRRRRDSRAVPGGRRPRHLRPPAVPQGALPDPGHAGGRGRRDLRHQAGHLGERPGRDRVQGWQRRREHRQRRPAVPVRPGPDVHAHRPYLRRPPALDHRLDDGGGDRHRTAEARDRGPRRLQGGDGQDRPDRGLAADPVDRRHELRLHRRDGRPAPRRDPAAGQDRPGAGQPGSPPRPSRRRSASRPSTPGRPRSCRPSTRPRSTRRRRVGAGGPAHRGTGADGGHHRPGRAGAAARRNCAQRQLVAEVVKPAEAEAEKVRILAQADAERMRDPGRGGRASHDRVALDRMLIDQLPQIVKEAANGLAGANVNVLNGAEGLGELDRRPGRPGPDHPGLRQEEPGQLGRAGPGAGQRPGQRGQRLGAGGLEEPAVAAIEGTPGGRPGS